MNTIQEKNDTIDELQRTTIQWKSWVDQSIQRSQQEAAALRRKGKRGLRESSSDSSLVPRVRRVPRVMGGHNHNGSNHNGSNHNGSNSSSTQPQYAFKEEEITAGKEDDGKDRQLIDLKKEILLLRAALAEAQDFSITTEWEEEEENNNSECETKRIHSPLTPTVRGVNGGELCSELHLLFSAIRLVFISSSNLTHVYTHTHTHTHFLSASLSSLSLSLCLLLFSFFFSFFFMNLFFFFSMNHNT